MHASHARIHNKPRPPVHDNGPFGVMTVADEVRDWICLPVWAVATEWQEERVKVTVAQYLPAYKMWSNHIADPPLREFSFTVGPEEPAAEVFRALEWEGCLQWCRWCKRPMRADSEGQGFTVQSYLCYRCGWRKPA